MAVNVCPGCKEVVLSFGDESKIKCSKCETSFDVAGNIDDTENNNFNLSADNQN